LEAGIYRQRLEGVVSQDHRLKTELTNHKRNHERDPERYSPAPAPPDPGDRLARAFMIDCEKPNSLANFNRNKGSIELSIDRSLRQLKIYQSARHTSQPLSEPNETGQPEGQAVPPAEPDPPVVAPAVPPAEPIATPAESTDYHSNPRNGGIAQFNAVAIGLMVYALLHAVPEFVAALASLMTDPVNRHNRTKTNIFRLSAPSLLMQRSRDTVNWHAA
jgi:hypothetical protein